MSLWVAVVPGVLIGLGIWGVAQGTGDRGQQLVLLGWAGRIAAHDLWLVSAAGIAVGQATVTALWVTRLVVCVLVGLTMVAVLGIPVLCLVGLPTGALLPEIVLRTRAAVLRRRRRAGLLESVRLLRQLMQSSGLSVAAALRVLADSGPRLLRPEFAQILEDWQKGDVALAWRRAQARVGDPIFDLMAAAIILQRPSGGELGPLLERLEVFMTAMEEVVRETESHQAQIKASATLIAALPLVFLGFLGMTHSSYLSPYAKPLGEFVLLSMIGCIGASYWWMLRWLRLPAEPRLGAQSA